MFCGGIKLNATTLKEIEGIICEANAVIVDTTKAITGCGQLWDGDSFKKVKVGNVPCITHCASDETVIGTPVPVKANCGLALDGRFFTVNSNGVNLESGYLLKVNPTPADATVTVLDSQSHEIEPLTGTTNQYLASGNVSVAVEKDGYIGSTQTVNVNENKEVNVTIYPIAELTVNVTTPATGATIVVKDANNVTISPKTGTTNVYQCKDTQTYSVTVSATGYTTATENVTMAGAKTITIALAS